MVSLIVSIAWTDGLNFKPFVVTTSIVNTSDETNAAHSDVTLTAANATTGALAPKLRLKFWTKVRGTLRPSLSPIIIFRKATGWVNLISLDWVAKDEPLPIATPTSAMAKTGASFTTMSNREVCERRPRNRHIEANHLSPPSPHIKILPPLPDALNFRLDMI